MTRSIIVYYTWSGRTREMAERIAARTGADIWEILPETPYTQDYNAAVRQAKKEIREGYCPALRQPLPSLEAYDTVYVGTPIWWGTMAPPVAAFLKQCDWSGKTVMPFSTHGGGGKGRADRDIARLCPGAQVMDMYTAYEGGGKAADREIAAWLGRNE
ncbi:MAG: flavodoxin [Clostridia bacterium]|nr:flavodoxin [Clostridia bacterium]